MLQIVDYEMPNQTLKRHLDSNNVNANEGTKTTEQYTTSPLDVEQQLVDHLKKPEVCFLGLRRQMFLDWYHSTVLALLMSERNGVPHVYNEKKVAGKKWFYNIMKHYKGDILMRFHSSLIHLHKL